MKRFYSNCVWALLIALFVFTAAAAASSDRDLQRQEDWGVLYPDFQEITVLTPVSFFYRNKIYVIYGVKPPKKYMVKKEKKQLERILQRGRIEIRSKYVMPGGIIWAVVTVDGEGVNYIIKRSRIPSPSPRIDEPE